MKKAVGGSYVMNLVIIFLLIMFGFLMASVSYSKAYRVSKGVLSIIENHSGYNSVAEAEIERYLTGIGYNMTNVSNCPVKKDAAKKDHNADWQKNGICVYKIDEIKENNKTIYVAYGVVSYMSIDLPLIDLIKVPIYGETEKIYVFN